jgi:hypothetical protein
MANELALANGKQLTDPTQQLAFYHSAIVAIDKAASVDEVKEIRDKAAAVKVSQFIVVRLISVSHTISRSTAREITPASSFQRLASQSSTPKDSRVETLPRAMSDFRF